MFPGVGCSILLNKAITLFCKVDLPEERKASSINGNTRCSVSTFTIYHLKKKNLLTTEGPEGTNLFPSCC